MTNNERFKPTRRTFLKAAGGAGLTSLIGCGGSDEEQQKSIKYGFYLNETDASGLRDLAKFDIAVVHPNFVTAKTAKASGISTPIAYGSLIAIEGKTVNPAAAELAAQASNSQWLLKNHNGFDIKVPGNDVTSTTSASVVDIRIPAAYDAMKKYLTGLIDQAGYEGVYLDGLDRVVALENIDSPHLAGLSQQAVKLMNEVSAHAQKRKTVMVAAAFTKPITGTLNPLVEAMASADVTVVPQIFSATNDYAELKQTATAERSAAIVAAAKASGKKDVEIVGVEIARDPAAKLCNMEADYDSLTKNTNIHYSVFFDRPLLDEPYHLLPPRPGDITFSQPRKLQLTRPEIVAANAALVNQQQCLTR